MYPATATALNEPRILEYIVTRKAIRSSRLLKDFLDFSKSVEKSKMLKAEAESVWNKTDDIGLEKAKHGRVRWNKKKLNVPSATLPEAETLSFNS